MVNTVGVLETLIWREVIWLKAVTMSAVSDDMSMPCHGIEPCACLPFRWISKRSEAAIIGPGRQTSMPTGPGNACRPKIASTFGLVSTPSLTISGAPPSSPGGGPSSAGWKMKTTVPSIWSFMPARTSAVPIRIATWLSWPQACITGTVWPRYLPVAFEANGRPVCSATGKASMSARRATTLPGLPPFKIPTTPVLPTPVRTSRPSLRRWSATILAVRTSLFDSSGCSWKSRRQAITFGCSAAAWANTAAS